VKKLMKAVEDAKREVEREKAEQQAAETSQSTFQRLFRRSATMGHAIQTGASALAEGTVFLGDQ
jgi:hypothetical protein